MLASNNPLTRFADLPLPNFQQEKGHSTTKKEKGANPQSKPRPKSREEANRRDPNEVEKQNDQHSVGNTKVENTLRQQAQSERRHDHVGGKPHGRDVQQRLEARLGALVLGHAFDAALLDSQLAGGAQKPCREGGAGGEVRAGDGVAGVDDGGGGVGDAMLVGVVRAAGGGGLALGRGLFLEVVVVGGVAHLAYAGSCLDDGGEGFLPRTTVSEMEALK
jgi:hypothetical protein